MYTAKQVIKHMGWRLMLRNPKYDTRPNDKQRVPRFIKGGLFESRYFAHDYVRRHFPTYTSKDYRIVGVKLNFTPMDFFVPKTAHKAPKTAAEQITAAVETTSEVSDG